MHTAMADEVPRGAAAGGPRLVQANLVTASPQGTPIVKRQEAQSAALQASLQTEQPATAGADEADAHPTTAMLLSALVLMAGIALRRWGVGKR